jgi:hypothetical protein
MYLNKYLIAGAAVLVMSSAQASTVYTLDTTLGGHDIAATAAFEWSGSTLTLILTNDTDEIAFTLQELTGFHFTVSGAPVLQSVTGSALGGSVNCIGVAAGASCPIYETGPVDPFVPPQQLGSGAAPDGWAALPSLGLFTFGAGDGSWKPYGIVNNNVVGTGTGGNTGNAQHNPMLVGPVVFQFAFAPLPNPATITGVDFYWGTSGDHRAGSVCTTGDCGISSRDTPLPEPGTLALLALALTAAGMTLRRKPG